MLARMPPGKPFQEAEEISPLPKPGAHDSQARSHYRKKMGLEGWVFFQKCFHISNERERPPRNLRA